MLKHVEVGFRAKSLSWRDIYTRRRDMRELVGVNINARPWLRADPAHPVGHTKRNSSGVCILDAPPAISITTTCSVSESTKAREQSASFFLPPSSSIAQRLGYSRVKVKVPTFDRPPTPPIDCCGAVGSFADVNVEPLSVPAS